MIRKIPALSHTWRCRGRLLERAGNADEAQADFEAACELDPGNAEYVASMGLHHRNQGRWKEALADFDRALQLDPARGPVYCHRGSVLQLSKPETRSSHLITSHN